MVAVLLLVGLVFTSVGAGLAMADVSTSGTAGVVDIAGSGSADLGPGADQGDGAAGGGIDAGVGAVGGGSTIATVHEDPDGGLPFTGLAALPLAAGGALLMTLGVGLRRRAAP